MRRFAVIGLGYFGNKLALSLAEQGGEVIAIDKDLELVEEIADRVDLAVKLDAADKKALIAQDVPHVDTAIVAIGKDFENAVLVTMTLKELGVPRVIARCRTETQRLIMKKIGADELVSPEDQQAVLLSRKLLQPNVFETIALAPGQRIVEIMAPDFMHSRSLKDLNLRNRYRVNLIAIRRTEDGDPVVEFPTAETVVEKEDRLVVIGADKDIEELTA